jgi:hypothetical protein
MLSICLVSRMSSRPIHKLSADLPGLYNFMGGVAGHIEVVASNSCLLLSVGAVLGALPPAPCHHLFLPAFCSNTAAAPLALNKNKFLAATRIGFVATIDGARITGCLRPALP